jgi:serine/threonine protein kinase
MLIPGSILQHRYDIEQLLGHGGFGAVYRAYDRRLAKNVAIKEVFDHSTGAERQFEFEAQLLAALRHPALPTVIDHFVEASGHYLVMEYIAGEHLGQYLARQPHGLLNESEGLAIIAPILDALAYLHSRTPPIIHRDIKPENIRISPEAAVFLVDFGLAKAYDPMLKTASGARAVTPGFSPLEQYGNGVTDARSDLYALGATLYTILGGAYVPEAIARAMDAPLPPLRTLNATVSPRIEAITTRLLAMRPEERYPNVAALRQALEQDQHTTIRDTNAVFRHAQHATVPVSHGAGYSDTVPVLETAGRAEQRVSRWRPVFVLIAGSLTLILAFFLLSSLIGRPREITVSAPVTLERPVSSPIGQPRQTTVSAPAALERTQAPGLSATATVGKGEMPEVLTGHTGAVLSVAWSPDGQTLASGSNDITLRLWHIADGQLARVMESRNMGGPTHLMYSTDGQMLFSVTDTFNYVPWSVDKGQAMANVLFDQQRIGDWPVAWSSDSQLFADGHAAGTIEIYRTADIRRFLKIPEPIGDTTSLAFGDSGKILASGESDGTVRLWSVQTLQTPHAQLLETLQGRAEALLSLAFSPDQQTLAGASSGGAVQIWRVADGKLVRTLEGHTGAVFSLAWSPDGGQIVTAGEDKTVRLWDVGKGELVKILRGHTGKVFSVAWSPDGHTIASASEDKTVRLWSVADLSQAK